MKRIKLIYALLLAVTLPLLTACYNDDATTVDNPTQQDGKIKVHLRVSQAAPTTTRALWQDNNATDDEMMNVWTVVAVNNNDGADKDKVVGIWSCKPSGEPDQEIDEIDAVLPSEGSYRFYSFANFGAEELSQLLFSDDTTIPTAEDDGVIVSSAENQINGKTLTEDKANSIAVNVKGNKFDPTSTEGNGFGATGIPMSNVQTFTLKEGDKKDLIVIRMLAKIKLQIYNDSGSDITIKSVTLTSLTANTKEGDAGYKNLMLLPNLKSKGNNEEKNDGHNTMNDIHGDIQPNLSGTHETEKVEIAVNETIAGSGHTFNDGETKALEVTFYVNESDVRKKDSSPSTEPTDPTAPSTTRAAEDAPDFYHFFLEIAVEGDNYVGDKKARYVMIDDKGETEADDKKWDYIARNDYRIIPIVLDDYKLDLIPYDFPAIGVYPASVKEEDGIYTINFHDYGHFHLLPVVTKYSDTNEKLQDKKKVPYGKASQTDADKTYWTLVEGKNDEETWENSWGTWADAKKIPPYTGNFYKTSNDTEDADDAGGAPIWYKNDGTDGPQWSPDGKEPYLPFIFGYINDPGESIKNDGDRKVYHEFSILLHKPDSDPRQMTYRLYMILDEEQMLYRSRSKAAPRCPHHWH